LLATLAALALGCAALTLGATRAVEPTATACAGGEEAEADAEAAGDETPAGGGAAEFFSGPQQEAPCEEGTGHPESFADLSKVNTSRLTRTVAPGTEIKPGAFRAAVRDRAALAVVGGTWQRYGNPPLLSNRNQYDTTNGSTNEGLGDLSGRVNAFAQDTAGNTYAAVSNGGIWKSTDRQHWTSIGDGLPTQVVAGVAWSPAGGGTLIALTGDLAYGGDTYAGLGVYRSTDGGATWTHSAGVPDGVLGFKLAVDPSDSAKVYAATGAGLWRSTDAGASFTNVDLPTGENAPAGTPDCTGQLPSVKDCFLANMVTDVVVQGETPAGIGGKPGAVMAAVGWRAGNAPNADGAQQSPGNGIYVSDTGAPGTFQNMDMAGHSQPSAGDPLTQARIGRVALGIAAGPQQDHRIVYALVQDAVKFNGGVTGLDVNEPSSGAPQSDYLNGVWVSKDFGASWKQLEGSTEIDNDPLTNSALLEPGCKSPNIGYCPGIQAWYNLWVSPDPTRATGAGVPTRVAFGLEEIWANDPGPLGSPPGGLDGSSPARFKVVGRYYAGTTCTILIITNSLPVCPAGTVPAYTTHPDQHAALWVPDASGGGVTLVAGNDGGVYKQHVAAGGDLANDQWAQGKPNDANGKPVAGANDGLNTLQPYDVAMANDGTAYMGLQDNGQAKIEPNGTMYTIFGGDGGFTAVDPANSNVNYEEYTYGDIAVTADGGKTWKDIQPSNLTSSQFTTPFEMDPNNANHLMIGGRDIEETTAGPNTTSSSWKKVYDLGTQQHPGESSPIPPITGDDPDNQLSAVDVRSDTTAGGLPTGPKTADQHFTGKGGDTRPSFDEISGTVGLPTQQPGTYNDYPVTISPTAGDDAMDVTVSWPDNGDDWDLYLYRNDGGQLTFVDSGGGTDRPEHLQVADPEPGDYVVRVVNYLATGNYDLDIGFTQRTDPGIQSTTDYAYVGFCGYCDTITQGTPFGNGIATNVGGDKPGSAGTSDGWHIAGAHGLPSRYITSIRMDPQNPRTVYVTLAGYGRRWAFPGAVGEDTSGVGTGHVFVSTDAGEHFTDISGNLPDVPANWSVLHNGRLAVGTDIGVFVSCNDTGGNYAVLGNGLPSAPISTMSFKPNDPDLLIGATYGRGIYTYRFDDAQPLICHEPPTPPGGGGDGSGGGGGSGGDQGLEPLDKSSVELKIARHARRKARVKLINRTGLELTGTAKLKHQPRAARFSLPAHARVVARVRLPHRVRAKLGDNREARIRAVVRLSDPTGRSLKLKKSRQVTRRHRFG
jgi:hypothetical protein